MKKNRIMKVSEFKSRLKQLKKEDLIIHLASLYQNFDNVKDYFISVLNPDEQKNIQQKYKAAIQNEFFPKRGLGKARLSIAKKAISDFRKISNSSELICDLMLFYVEQGVEFTNAYGDINEQFYISMEDMYARTLKLMEKNDLAKVFKKRCFQIVVDTDGIGWGFHDALADLYYEYFEI